MACKTKNNNNCLLRMQFWSLGFVLVVLSYFSLVWLFPPAAKFTAQLKSLNKNRLLIFSKTCFEGC